MVSSAAHDIVNSDFPSTFRKLFGRELPVFHPGETPSYETVT